MEYSDNDTFCLFKHDKKGNEKAPDYSGYIYDQNGNKRKLACWLRDGKTGKFMSGKVEDYREQAAPQQQPHTSRAEPQSNSAPPVDDGFDSIPY